MRKLHGFDPRTGERICGGHTSRECRPGDHATIIDGERTGWNVYLLQASEDGQGWRVQDHDGQRFDVPRGALQLLREEDDNLIERAEREMGRRYDASTGEGELNPVLSTLFGAAHRALHPEERRRPEDDHVVGTLIQHGLSPEGREQARRDEEFARLLRSPGGAAVFFGLFGG